MKKAFFLLAALFCLGGAVAQEPMASNSGCAIQGRQAGAKYAYCEIISSHLPSHNGDGVLFDFGQPTKALSYNWLKNAEGQKLKFNSSIEALNYMTHQGWEFVQAYTSGEKNQNTHLLLRIATSRLSEEQQQMLDTPPTVKSGKDSAR